LDNPDSLLLTSHKHGTWPFFSFLLHGNRPISCWWPNGWLCLQQLTVAAAKERTAAGLPMLPNVIGGFFTEAVNYNKTW